jgi:carbamoyl-phosphate synthase large subunit
MEKKTVLVTGIGGNVGQGIVRNIRKDFKNIKIVGTNISELSAGNHLVDVFYKVPYGYDVDYLPSLHSIIKNEKVDLVIPSTDFEVAVLAENAHAFSVMIACSGKESSSIYLDKYLSSIFHEKHNIAFAESYLPSEYSGQFSFAIAKPRKGRGSKGLIINYSGKENLNDDEYLIQKMYVGNEITTAVYCSYQTGKLVGLITMERSLENGATTHCKVMKKYDEKIKEIAQEIIDNTDIRGSFNIQSIVTENESIYPFEINCRISGTNSIRSHFGFEDVKYTVDELLYNNPTPENINIIEGEAFRYLSDVIYTTDIITGTKSDTFTVF